MDTPQILNSNILEAILPKLQKTVDTRNQNQNQNGKLRNRLILGVYNKTIVIDHYNPGIIATIIISEDTIKIIIKDHDKGGNHLIELAWTDPDILQKLTQHIKTL